MTLIWKGERIRLKMAEAQRIGINLVMSRAVMHAKRNHEWRNRTGTLEGSIAIAEYAKPEGTGYRGVWGSRDVRYALIHEMGGKIVPKRAAALIFQVQGRWVRTQQVRIPARPYLRPAADATYPGLVAAIRGAFSA